MIRAHGRDLDVVQRPKIRVTVSPPERRRRGLGRWRRIVPEAECPESALCSIQQVTADWRPEASAVTAGWVEGAPGPLAVSCSALVEPVS